MSTNTELPSMNVGNTTIRAYSGGLTVVDRNTTPASILVKVDALSKLMQVNGDIIVGGDAKFNGGVDLGLLAVDDLQYPNQQFVVATTGEVINVDEAKTILVVAPAGPIATLTIVMPAAPDDGELVQIAISQNVGAITHTAAPNTIANPLLSAVAPETAHYYYHAGTTTWYKTVTGSAPASVTLACIQDVTPAPNVQLCSTTNSLLGLFNNGADQYFLIDRANNNIGLGIGSINALTTGSGNVSIGQNTLGVVTTGNGNVAIGQNTLAATTSTNLVGVGFESLAANTSGLNLVAVGSNSLTANTTGNENVAVGPNVLAANISSSSNTGIGFNALAANISGSGNVATGSNSLLLNSTGTDNVAVGLNSAGANTTGSGNVAIGSSALSMQTTGSNNVSIGFESAFANSAFSEITAVGANALRSNSASTSSTAIGFNALTTNMGGSGNVAVGHTALAANVIGNDSTAVGTSCLSVSTGDNNTGVGASTLAATTTGVSNSGFGMGALSMNSTGSDNTAIGDDALGGNLNGNNNIGIGSGSGNALLLSDNICIGNVGLAGDSGTIRIGTAGTHTGTIIESNLHVGVFGSPGSGALYLQNAYVDSSGPYGDGATVPNPTIVFGAATIAVWMIPLSTAALPTGLTVTMPAPVAAGQTMSISFTGVAGPPAVLGTGIVYSGSVDTAHVNDVTALATGANAFSSTWYVNPTGLLWTRIG